MESRIAPLLFFIMLLSCSDSFRQKVKQETVTYEDVNTKKVRGWYTGYTTKDGQTFKIGDKIILGSASNGNTYSNIKQNAGISIYDLSNNAASSELEIKKYQLDQK